MVITLSGAPAAASDTIVLSLPCTGGVSFGSGSTGEASTAYANYWTATVANNSNCAATDTNLVLAQASGTGTATLPTVIDVTPQYATSSATAGSVTVTGSYISTSANTVTTFGVTSDATVQAVTVSTSPISVTKASLSNAIGTITVTVPAAYVSQFTQSTGTDVQPVCLELTGSSGSENFNVSSGEPTVTQSNGAEAGITTAATQLEALNTDTGSTTTSPSSTNLSGVVEGNTIAFGVAGTETGQSLSFTVTGAHVDGTTNGTATVSVYTGGTPVATSTATTASGTAGTGTVVCGTGATNDIGSTTLYTVGTSPGAIYGSDGTADGTAASEFLAANTSFTSSSDTCNTSYNAVLATDAAATNGSDAMAASYLESYLQAGVLITSPTSLNSDVLNALKAAGTERVYVVGGPLAISQSVISQLQSTPSYVCGGLASRGFDLTVYSGIAGSDGTADGTAAAIDSYVPTTFIGTASFTNAYSAASATTGGGLYNQTAGNASATGPSGSVATAIVVSDSDYQDTMAAAGLAYDLKLPVILTPATGLGTDASSELTALGIKQVIALGGNLALTNAVVSSIQSLSIPVLRIAGVDYTQTAADIAQFEAAQLGWADQTVLVAQGSYWSDAIGAAQLSAGWSLGVNSGAPESVLLTESPGTDGPYLDAALKLAGTPSKGLGTGVTSIIQVLGGPLAITSAQQTEMQQALLSGA